MSSLATSDHVLYRSHSNSSISSSSSSSSLARRPSIRRSRLRNNGGYVHKSPSELPYLDKPSVQEHESQGQLLRPPEQDTPDERDLRARASGSLQSSEGAALDVTMVADPQPSPMVAKLSKAVERASSLPDIITNHNPPSAASFHEPCLTPIANMRDSVSTQKSGTSSSVYPLSISSASGPDSPTSLRTMSEDIEHIEVSSFEPEVEELPDFDPDDVSYRLRLLVKNNYFLPPAHSKPALSELSPSDTTRKSNRAATPTFLDIFRVNKSKSKPASPVVETMPMLRATGDSIMTPHLPQPRVSTQIPRPSLNVVVNERVGRVVVVREKMEDIGLAAKQAEQDIKSRAHVRRDLYPLDLEVPDVPIDPTDAVDIPPPPPFYPFPMQTSTLHGLGVTESLGAAILAEHLPPGSPGLSSIDATDDWRRILLHEAVHHSLDGSADLSSFSQVIGISTPVASPQGKESRSSEVSPTPPPRILLQQRIMEPFPDSSDDSFRDVRQEKASASKTMLSKDATVGVSERLSVSQRVPSNRSSYLPARVDTPTDPLTALTPPPPRKQVNVFASQSQIDLPMSKTAEPLERQCRTPTPTLRKSASSAMLSDGHGSDILRTNRITPPPFSGAIVHPEGSSLESKSASGNTNMARVTMTESMYSEDEYADGSGRQSASLSAPMSRQSLSEYSRYSLSPTTSAFQEDLNNVHTYPSPHSTSQESEQISANRDSPLPRDTTMSPPPRISSSLAHVALPPPPRASSQRHPSLSARRGSHPQQSIKSSLDSVMEFGDPEPSTPPPPPSDRRGNPSTTSPAFQTPKHGNVDASLHTAPAPSSPTSFFDNIQSNALDDLDSSSDEGDAVHATIYGDVRSRTMSNVSSPSKSLLMRLGNHSTPYFSRTTRSADDQHGPLPFGVQDPKQPIVNMPQLGQSSAQQRIAKGDNGRGAPVTSFDFYEYSKQHWSGLSTDFSETRRPATAGESRPTGKKANLVAAESLRRLDGLVQQHMEAEKDTMKRIAKTLQSSNNQGTQFHNT